MKGYFILTYGIDLKVQIELNKVEAQNRLVTFQRPSVGNGIQVGHIRLTFPDIFGHFKRAVWPEQPVVIGLTTVSVEGKNAIAILVFPGFHFGPDALRQDVADARRTGRRNEKSAQNEWQRRDCQKFE
jgi:hypothetical protein